MISNKHKVEIKTLILSYAIPSIEIFKLLRNIITKSKLSNNATTKTTIILIISMDIYYLPADVLTPAPVWTTT